MPVTFSRLHTVFTLVKATAQKLSANDPLRMAGATAFFTSFALPPIIMIIVRTLGLFIDRRIVGTQISGQLSMVLGKESTESILKTIRSFRALQHNYIITAALFLFLVFVATTLFKVITGSINQIWEIRRKKEGKVLSGLRERAFSLAIILLGGILFLSVQLIDAGRHLAGRSFMDVFPKTSFYLGGLLSELVVIGLSAVWFFMLFLLLPDARPHRKIMVTGALLTSVLFNLGKWILQFLLRPGKVNNFYGASGALVLLLLFVFYSSIILYTGATFIKVWGDHCNKPLRLKPGVQRYRLEDIGED